MFIELFVFFQISICRDINALITPFSTSWKQSIIYWYPSISSTLIGIYLLLTYWEYSTVLSAWNGLTLIKKFESIILRVCVHTDTHTQTHTHTHTHTPT